MRALLRGLDRGVAAVASATVVLLLLGMVGLSFTQVLLRNLFGGGLPWAEVVLQHAVLAVGMFGAVLAARQGRQIAIDVLSRITGRIGRALFSWLGGLFTIGVSLILAKASWVFVMSEKEFGTELAGELPAWLFQLVIPIGFALIALQMLLNLLLGRSTQPDHVEAAGGTGVALDAESNSETEPVILEPDVSPATEQSPTPSGPSETDTPSDEPGDEPPADDEEGRR